MGCCNNLGTSAWWKAKKNSWGKQKSKDSQEQKHGHVHFNIYKYFFSVTSRDFLDIQVCTSTTHNELEVVPLEVPLEVQILYGTWDNYYPHVLSIYLYIYYEKHDHILQIKNIMVLYFLNILNTLDQLFYSDVYNMDLLNYTPFLFL